MLLKGKVFLLIFVLFLTSREYVTAQLNSEVPVGLATLLAVGGSGVTLLLMYLQALRDLDQLRAECTRTSSAKEECEKKLAECIKKEADCQAALKKATDDLKKAKADCDEKLRQRDAEKTAELAALQQKCNNEKAILNNDKAILSAELEKAKKDCAKTIAENNANFQTQLANEKAKCDAAIKKLEDEKKALETTKSTCETEKATLQTAKTKCDTDLTTCQTIATQEKNQLSNNARSACAKFAPGPNQVACITCFQILTQAACTGNTQCEWISLGLANACRAK